MHKENTGDVIAVPHSPRITVMIGYSWAKSENGLGISPRNDGRWQAIKSKVKSEANAIKTYARNRKPALHKVDICIERLRGTHGDMLLGNLLGRIKKADVLIFDVGSFESGSFEGGSYNSNVLLEIGMALALARHEQRRLFVLKPQSLKTPSDLSGFLFTDYHSADGKLKLSDDPGFRAALRSSLMEIARSRGMIGDPRNNQVEIEAEKLDTGRPKKSKPDNFRKSSKR